MERRDSVERDRREKRVVGGDYDPGVLCICMEDVNKRFKKKKLVCCKNCKHIHMYVLIHSGGEKKLSLST